MATTTAGTSAPAPDTLRELIERIQQASSFVDLIDQEMQKIQAVMQQYEEGAGQHEHQHQGGAGSEGVV